MADYILAIDQGTTSTRAIVFDTDLKVVSVAQEDFDQHFPNPGWVEHDPEDLFNTTVSTCRAALEKANLKAGEIASIGITNQRETTVLWDRNTGKAIHNAIVWQDRRAAELCAELVEAGHEEMVVDKTGLLIDSYFSGNKVRWVLKSVDGARDKAEAGELMFGTVETWLIWRLTGGAVHATDATNASRTMMYDIRNGKWDDELLALLDVPASVLPEVKDSSADYGQTLEEFFGAPIKIGGAIGDQQSAAVGQACFSAGMMKSTYGTGCFALLNTGDQMVRSNNRLLTTVAYQIDGKTSYALEGSIFIAGAVVQWLRDGLKMITDASETQAMAQDAAENQDVVMVPAFTGLGAPYWDAHARGAIFGLSRGTGPNEFARAALQSVGYQTRDLLEAMHKDWENTTGEETILRVDGGMTASDWTMQFLSDILGAPVDRPTILETTAVGAAYMAGLHAGVLPAPDEFAKLWALEKRFTPTMDETERQGKYERWQDCVSRTLSRA
ncbi:glycerol kinase GlpK [Terasakiella sp. A23]|uniref:glycerol kinase GlpK n=1 Tax=Terasakiella sp. FCG-A23 TaxID=3080561 RepID=UPI00295544C1|nr:glycerol kinase GlpK [Terasakiella sp. A23]MDV7341084.1 glycerol kinase GlpK [Terasakiella sp. A23]